jgi:cytochrome c oxidase subunit 2
VSLVLKKRFRQVAVSGLVVGALLVLSGCSSVQEDEIKRLALPIPSTKEADTVYDLWMWSWLAAMLTGIVVWGLIFYACIRFYRRSQTDIPVKTR